jgi:hypothetical protein
MSRWIVEAQLIGPTEQDMSWLLGKSDVPAPPEPGSSVFQGEPDSCERMCYDAKTRAIEFGTATAASSFELVRSFSN